jgi:hypothetical protein
MNIMLKFSVMLATGALCLGTAHAQPLPGAPNCMGQVVTTRSCLNGVCSNGPSIASTRGWHGLGLCLRDLRDIISRQGATTSVTVAGQYRIQIGRLTTNSLIYGFRNEKVGISPAAAQKYGPITDSTRIGIDSKVALLNDEDKPFNGMSQMDMAASLTGLARVLPADQGDTRALFMTLARVTLNPVVSSAAEGGLAEIRPCADRRFICAWFHSVTGKGHNAQRTGALNQHLHVVRDLLSIARSSPDGDRLNAFATYGLNQLFFGAAPDRRPPTPTFSTFLGAPGPDGKGRVLDYGYSLKADKLSTYLLPDGAKNCHYAYHDLELLADILSRPSIASSPAARKALACSSPIVTADAAMRALQDQGSPALPAFMCGPKFNYGQSKAGKFFSNRFGSCARNP